MNRLPSLPTLLCLFVLVPALALPGAALAHGSHDAGGGRKKAAFGPWDAGDKRPVKRQGKAGKTRLSHPVLGDPAKVPASGPPAPDLRQDPDVPETALGTVNVVGGGLSANPLFLAALVYSNFLTKMDGPRCQHYPTCSRFANQAVARHGVLGIVLGVDRLIQDDHSSTARRLPEIDTGGSMRLYDPLENYEFWLKERITAFPPAVPEEPLALPALDDGGSAPQVSTR